jgi:hypothetical protein
MHRWQYVLNRARMGHSCFIGPPQVSWQYALYQPPTHHPSEEIRRPHPARLAVFHSVIFISGAPSKPF